MRRIVIIIVAAAAGIFAWWAFSPLLFDVEVNDELPSNTRQETDVPTPEQVTETTDTETETDVVNTEEPEAAAEPGERVYPITGTTGHPASGNIRVALTPEEKIVRYENYEGTNGPDLKIYLAKDLEANEYIDLGPSRANKGNINYSVPMNIDVDDYQYVLTWCEAFGVLFDYAEIN